MVEGACARVWVKGIGPKDGSLRLQCFNFNANSGSHDRLHRCTVPGVSCFTVHSTQNWGAPLSDEFGGLACTLRPWCFPCSFVSTSELSPAVKPACEAPHPPVSEGAWEMDAILEEQAQNARLHFLRPCSFRGCFLQINRLWRLGQLFWTRHNHFILPVTTVLPFPGGRGRRARGGRLLS